MRRLVSLVAGLAVTAALLTLTQQPAYAVVPCSRGLVALTFDDGPAGSVTPQLLDVLRNRRVRAAFFVVGQRVATTPRIARRTSRLGHVVGNHTYRHERLTGLSNSQIAATLRATRRAIINAGARPSPLMRPPYGSIDARVRSVVADLDMVPVLWDIDPRDWAGGSGSEIAARVLNRLRPGQRNIVLLHDGVRNSPNTLRAVPIIIRGARTRGYCFGWLGPGGGVRPPVPVASVSDAAVTEVDPGSFATLRFVVRLSEPTSRRTSIRVRTEGVTATAGTDFGSRDERIYFPIGTTRRVVTVRVRGDLLDEPDETMRLRLLGPRGVRIGDGIGIGRIRDDDPPPSVGVSDVSVVEPADGTQTSAQVPVRLNRASARVIEVRVRTVAGTATGEDFVPRDVVMTFQPGQTARTFAVTVVGDAVAEPAEQFTVRASAVRNVTVGDGTAVVLIEPPPAPESPPAEEPVPTPPG
jgi:peptidoglycan-N-acetylglucosamine deacetylase